MYRDSFVDGRLCIGILLCLAAQLACIFKACERKTLGRLISMQSGYPPEHFWDEINHQIPLWHRLEIIAKRPSDGATLQESAKCYDDMEAFLHQHSADCFGPSSKSTGCRRHPGQSCPVSWQHDSDVPVSQRPIVASMGGPMCVPFTQHGLKRGFADPNTESYHIWSLQQRYDEFDIIQLENDCHFPKQQFANQMPHCKTVAIDSSVTDLGVPVQRRRLLATALNSSTLVWVGPDTDEAKTKKIDKKKTSLCRGLHMGWP